MPLIALLPDLSPLPRLDLGRLAGIGSALVLNGAMWSALVRLSLRFFLHH